MKLKNVKAVYYSAAGHTRYIVCEIAKFIAEKLDIPWETYDFTLPEKRQQVQYYDEDNLIIFGTPVYAGRIPNKLLPTVQTLFKGNKALAVPVVTFGNRSYDNALIELRNELENNEFHTIAAAAFVAEHVFSNKIAAGRPDEEDQVEIYQFASAVADKIKKMNEIPEKIQVKGTEPIPAYYIPLGMDGKPAVFLKAKPKTIEKCTNCKQCVSVCPMGSIDYDCPSTVSGICIKCHACIKVCPVGAKYFDDEAMLSHIAMLEHNYIRRAKNESFI